MKYGPCPLDLAAFRCETSPAGFIRRVCYLQAEAFLVIDLGGTWYPYCSVDPATAAALSGPDAGRFYNRAIRSRGGVHGPFDCRDRAMPVVR